MPELVFEKVLSVSNELKNFPAENLLEKGEFKKWKCSPGDPKAIVILQLPEATTIDKINIGNEGSAFVEVFVSKSSIKEEDFQLILPASSFMTPVESRNGQNLSNLRFFNKENLIKTVVEQKWNILKVVCTQPFNKNLPYGLSFITVHSQQTKNSAQVDVNAFLLDPATESNASFKVGSLFEKSRQKRTASSSINASTKDTSVKKMKDDEDTFSKESGKKETAELSESKGKRPAREDLSSQVPLKKSKAEKNDQGQLQESETESCRLMKNVVFVLSGFKNPLRAELRDKAVAMGAKYKADWEDHCTHLICAFEKTPKFNQVKGLTKIVSKAWILNSFNKKQLMPWRDYRLGGAPSPRKTTNSCSSEETSNNHPQGEESDSTGSSENCIHDKKDDLMDALTDSECDSDDEVERVERQNYKKIPAKDDLIDGLPELPNFFDDLKFLLYGDFTQEDRRYMKRHIVAYAGCLVDYMDKDVTTVISSKKWDSNFDDAIRDYPHLMFLKPDWLSDCIYHQKKVPFKNYQLSKQ